MKSYTLRETMSKEIEEKLETFPPLTRLLLFYRGIDDQLAAEKFLNPDYERDAGDPFLLKDMKKAVDRVFQAMERGEKIAIYSDYDADGIPGAVVLHDFFKKIGYKNFVNYIPLRNEEGFGLNHEAIDSLANDGVTLLITIDCGIADLEEVEVAKKHNIDFIITDHHVPKDKLPDAYAVINPKQEGDQYPEKMLCGAAVAFKLTQALCMGLHSFLEIGNWKFGIPVPTFPKGWEKWELDMVGIATLSDSVPLLSENRVLAHYGLRVLRKSPRVGLSKLFSILNIDRRMATEDDIAFMITPRINAASRMGVPHDAFKLLSTDDELEAGILADHLNNKNDERKGVVAGMVKEIKRKITERYGDGTEKMKHVLVIGNPEWKPSLLGLVASSFSDEHNKPVFLWGREGVNGGSVIKGSCRAGNGDSVLELMEKAGDIFIEYGGHRGAGGFSVSGENIHKLEDRLNEAFIEIQSKMPSPGLDTMFVDKKISLDDLSWQLWDEVARFAPFGYENPKPIFLLENLKVKNIKRFGKEKNHLELQFEKTDGSNVSAISFFTAPEKFSAPVEIGGKINLVATLEKSVFRNYPELRLRIVDIF